jgi:hypothetical protein
MADTPSNATSAARIPGKSWRRRPFGGTGQPDPLRAHGAWIYLFAAVGAGALVGDDHPVEPALLVGTGFAGVFLMAAALSVGGRRKIRQFLVGASLAILCPLAAFWLHAEPVFLLVAALALVPAAACIVAERKLGFLSKTALITGVAALAMAAPVVASAGGVSWPRTIALFGLLATFFCWRTLRVAAPLQGGGAWNRHQLRTRGLREAAFAAVWTLAVVVALRVSLD